MQNPDFEKVNLKLQKCEDCGFEEYCLYSVNVVLDWSSGFSLVKHICGRCKRRRLFNDPSRVEKLPSVGCAMCLREIFYNSRGVFTEKLRECKKCGKIFCRDCHKIAEMALCIEKGYPHWIRYSGLS